MHRTLTVAVMFALLAAVVSAADQRWQTGTWTEAETKRQLIDFGPGASPFGRGSPAGTMRALADVSTYVIETDDLRLELKDVVPIGHRSVDVTVGTSVTFALAKNTVYVRAPDGTEHKLRVAKKVPKTR